MFVSSWSFELQWFLSFSPDDDVIWFVSRVVVDSSWLDSTGQEVAMSQALNQPALLPCQMEKHNLDDDNDRKGDPKLPRMEWNEDRQNQMVPEIQFWEMIRWRWDNDLSSECIALSHWFLFDLSHVRPWQDDPWFLTNLRRKSWGKFSEKLWKRVKILEKYEKVPRRFCPFVFFWFSRVLLDFPSPSAGFCTIFCRILLKMLDFPGFFCTVHLKMLDLPRFSARSMSNCWICEVFLQGPKSSIFCGFVGFAKDCLKERRTSPNSQLK